MLITKVSSLVGIDKKTLQQCIHGKWNHWNRKFVIKDNTGSVAVVSLNFFERVQRQLYKIICFNYFKSVFGTNNVKVVSKDKLKKIDQKISQQKNKSLKNPSSDTSSGPSKVVPTKIVGIPDYKVDYLNKEITFSKDPLHFLENGIKEVESLLLKIKETTHKEAWAELYIGMGVSNIYYFDQNSNLQIISSESLIYSQEDPEVIYIEQKKKDVDMFSLVRHL